MAESVVGVGGGLAGLVAAWRAATVGQRVELVTQGWGALAWHAGTIDVLGYQGGVLVAAPGKAIDDLGRRHPDHPYAKAGLANLVQALAAFGQLCGEAGYPLEGSLEKNWLLPSAVGALRPTCLAPASMIAGDLTRGDPMLLVGLEGYQDFHPELAATNLAAQGVQADSIMLALPALRRRAFLNARVLASLFEEAEFRAQVVAKIGNAVGSVARVGFPAVLGLERATEVRAELEASLDREVFEIPVLPPSIPGLRLQRILRTAIESAGGRVHDGMSVVGAEVEGTRVKAVLTEAAARRQRHSGDHFVLATGGILGGGMVTGFEQPPREVVFGLPVETPAGNGLAPRFFDPGGHSVYRSGIRVDSRLRPLNARGPRFANLVVAGSAIGGCDPIAERSLEGVALATGWLAGGRSVEET